MATSQRPENPDLTTADVRSAKDALRRRVTAARGLRSEAEKAIGARALAGHLLVAPEVRRAATVAAYVSIGSEPGTTWLLEGLQRAGVRVLLPVLLPDGDLDWGVHTGPDDLVGGRMGLREPGGPRLGVAAVAEADVVLVPGLAVSPAGMRLGRGGGSYDRALARVPAGTLTCVLLHDDEIDLPVPTESHDRAVGAVATPSGMNLFVSG